MTMLELKEKVKALTPRQRRELNVFLIRLRHETPEWKRTVSARMRAMDSGKKIPLEEVERRHGNRQPGNLLISLQFV